MMQRLKVDVLSLVRLRNGDAYAEARCRCLRCEDSCVCLLWLDEDGTPPGPDFCPNLEFFNACKIHALRVLSARRRASAVQLAQSEGQRQDLSSGPLTKLASALL